MQGAGGKILRRLPALPARARLLAKLPSLEGVNAEKPEIGRDRIAIKRPRGSIEGGVLGGIARRAGGDKQEGQGRNARHATISRTTKPGADGSVDTRKGWSGSAVRKMLTFLG